MKKILLFTITLCSLYQTFAQKAVLVNGGQFGNPNEKVNVVIINIPTLTYDTLDTIRTGSVQDILIANEQFFVVAQDSIVKYDVKNGLRIAEQAFPGPSTRTLALNNDELLVGNWFGKSTDNLYIYDAEDLQLLDSISAVEQGVTSILIDSGYAYISQNQSTNSFEDTLGMIIKVDIANRAVVDTITVAGYTDDFGMLVEKPDGSGFYSINSFSNTITSIDFTFLNASNTIFNESFEVNSRSQWSTYKDTLFLRMNGGIGAINLTDLSIIDSLIIDTIITAFTYDALNKQFMVTQSNFSGFTNGAIYNRAGLKLDNFITGISPEVIDIIPAQPVGLSEVTNAVHSLSFELYPNPTSSGVHIDIKEDEAANAEYRLFDAKGQLVLKKVMANRKSWIDLSGMEKGFYFITISNKEKIASKKIILQ